MILKLVLLVVPVGLSCIERKDLKIKVRLKKVNTICHSTFFFFCC